MRLAEAYGLHEEVQVFRGMTGLPASDLRKLIRSEPDDEGVVSPGTIVSTEKNPWWSTKLGLAVVYASTPNANGSKGEYDVVVVGGMSEDARGFLQGKHGVVDFKSSKRLFSIRIERVAYVKRGKDSSARLRELLGKNA